MDIDIIDVILGVQRTDTTLSHMFLLPPEHGIWGGFWQIGLTDVARSWEAR